MFTAILLSALLTVALYVAWVLHGMQQQLKQLQASKTDKQAASKTIVAPTEVLQDQVEGIHAHVTELHQDMHTMGEQVQQLHMLAGHMMQGFQHAQQEMSSGPPRLLIQLRKPSSMVQHDEDEEQEGEISLDDLPPEMLEKLKVFQAIYWEIVHRDDPSPSQKHPHWN